MQASTSLQNLTARPHDRIAIFGGSFNPPHVGHAAVIRALLAEVAFDQVWLLPTAHHAFAKELAPFADRAALLVALMREIDDSRVKLCTIENELTGKKNYTIDTLLALQTRYPEVRFTLVLGSDTRAELDQWHRIDELRKMVDFYFVARAGYETSPLPQAASTEIRERLKHGAPINDLVPKSVIAELMKRGMYTPK